MATTKKTEYMKLRSVKKKHCEGKATTADLNTAADKYVDHAVSKGKTKAEAKAIVSAVKAQGCSVSGTKRKPKARRRAH